MAINRVFEGDGYKQSIPVTNPASAVLSGWAVRFGTSTGIALTAQAAGGNVAANTSIDLGPGVFSVPTRAVDDNGASAIAIGDDLFYTDGDVLATALVGAHAAVGAPYISKKASGYYFGKALSANASGYALCDVEHLPSPGYGTLGAATVTNTMLAAMASARLKVGSAGNRPADVDVTGDVTISNAGVTAVGAGKILEAMLQVPTARGLGAVRVAHAKYVFGTDGGVQGAITPADTAIIPDNAIVFGAIINSPTALTSGGSATISVGTTAGSGSATIKALTAVATYSSDAVLAGAPVFTAGSAFKMTAAGSINITVAVADLTAGVLEIFAFYVVASA